MKLKSIIKTNKDLKKNGYKMVSRLHKLEKRKGMEKAYRAVYEDTYMFVLYIRALIEIIMIEYGETDEFIIMFKDKCDWFVRYLEQIAETKSKLNKSYLASFLKAYTKFFNRILEKHYPFLTTQDIVEKWNIGCLMAYIATWGV